MKSSNVCYVVGGVIDNGVTDQAFYAKRLIDLLHRRGDLIVSSREPLQNL